MTIVPASIAVGDLVIVTFIGAAVALVCNSVTDTIGNTYSPAAATFSIDAVNKFGRTFYSNAAFGGAAPTVTGTYSDGATVQRAMSLTRYSLTGAPAVLDGEAFGNSGGVAAASPMDSGPLTTTATDLLYGYNGYDTNTPTQPAGWTNRDTILNLVGDLIGATAGTYHYMPTFAGTNIWDAEIVAFRETSGSVVLGGSL